MSELIGKIVAAGEWRPRWIYVTKVDGDCVYGRTWVMSRRGWTKTDQFYARRAIGVAEPHAARPTQPPEVK